MNVVSSDKIAPPTCDDLSIISLFLYSVIKWKSDLTYGKETYNRYYPG